jgi:hypothetical protein
LEGCYHVTWVLVFLVEMEHTADISQLCLQDAILLSVWRGMEDLLLSSIQSQPRRGGSCCACA